MGANAQKTLHPATCLFVARALRDFGDGFIAVPLPIYLLASGFSALQVGVIATASLLGSALLTLAVGFLGATWDRRQLLLAAASLMIATGVAFAVAHDYSFLLVIAFVGTVNPSAGSVSVFVPLEHALLAREVADAERTKIFARYSLVGALAGAAGALMAAVPDLAPPAGLDRLTSIKAMFMFYALLGMTGGAFYWLIPRRRPVYNPDTNVALGPPAPSSTGLPRCSASTPSPADSWFNRCSPSGCSSASNCLWRRPVFSFSGRACCPHSHSRSRRGCRGASGSSTPWSSLIFPRRIEDRLRSAPARSVSTHQTAGGAVIEYDSGIIAPPRGCHQCTTEMIEIHRWLYSSATSELKNIASAADAISLMSEIGREALFGFVHPLMPGHGLVSITSAIRAGCWKAPAPARSSF